LQGNLDPAVLLASPEVARNEARRVLDAYGSDPGHVFNLGHGITPQASIDAVHAVVDEVRTYSERLRRSGTLAA
jgi:uroporphyrinogen decarboxylase